MVDMIESYYSRAQGSSKSVGFPEYSTLYLDTLESKNFPSKTMLENFVSRVQSDADRFKQKIKEAESKSGALFLKTDPTKIECLLGDPHTNRLKLKVKELIFYEDPFNSDDAINSLCTIEPELKKYFYESALMPGGVRLRDFIKASTSVADLDSLYYEIGGMVAVIAFFKIIDIHEENLIIDALGHPRLIDPEYIFFPEYKSEYFRNFTINKTSLINNRTVGNASGLFGGLYNHLTYLTPHVRYENNNLHEPYVIWETETSYKLHNLPDLDGKHPNSYRSNIVAGYMDMSKVLLEKSAQFVQFLKSAEFKTRFILRPSSIYRLISLSSLYADKDTTLEQYLASVINDYPLLEIEKLSVKSVVEYEIKELQSFYIPYYVTHFSDTAVWTPYGDAIGYLKRTQKELAIDHIQNFEKRYKRYLGELKRALTINEKLFLKHKAQSSTNV